MEKGAKRGFFFCFSLLSSSPAHLGPFSPRPGPWRRGTPLLPHLSTVEAPFSPFPSHSRRHGGRWSPGGSGRRPPFISSPGLPLGTLGPVLPLQLRRRRFLSPSPSFRSSRHDTGEKLQFVATLTSSSTLLFALQNQIG